MKQSQEVYNIYYNKEDRFVVMDWNGYATSAQFREGTEYMLQILVENKLTKVLGDTKHMTIISQEDQKWIENDFLPRAVQHGCRAIALVQPISYFNKVAIESVSFKVDQAKVLISIFEDAEEARTWLNSLPF